MKTKISVRDILTALDVDGGGVANAERFKGILAPYATQMYKDEEKQKGLVMAFNTMEATLSQVDVECIAIEYSAWPGTFEIFKDFYRDNPERRDELEGFVEAIPREFNKGKAALQAAIEAVKAEEGPSEEITSIEENPVIEEPIGPINITEPELPTEEIIEIEEPIETPVEEPTVPIEEINVEEIPAEEVPIETAATWQGALESDLSKDVSGKELYLTYHGFKQSGKPAEEVQKTTGEYFVNKLYNEKYKGDMNEYSDLLVEFFANDAQIRDNANCAGLGNFLPGTLSKIEKVKKAAEIAAKVEDRRRKITKPNQEEIDSHTPKVPDLLALDTGSLAAKQVEKVFGPGHNILTAIWLHVWGPWHETNSMIEASVSERALKAQEKAHRSTATAKFLQNHPNYISKAVKGSVFGGSISFGFFLALLPFIFGWPYAAAIMLAITATEIIARRQVAFIGAGIGHYTVNAAADILNIFVAIYNKIFRRAAGKLPLLIEQAQLEMLMRAQGVWIDAVDPNDPDLDTPEKLAAYQQQIKDVYWQQFNETAAKLFGQQILDVINDKVQPGVADPGRMPFLRLCRIFPEIKPMLSSSFLQKPQRWKGRMPER